MLQNQLPADALGKETIQHRHQYTAEELAAKKEEVISILNQIEKREKEMKDFCDPLKHQNKLKTQELMEVRTSINVGFQMEERECFLIPDFTNKSIQYLSVDTNELLWERPMRPDERQYAMADLRKVV